jgi:hypothetical protein
VLRWGSTQVIVQQGAAPDTPCGRPVVCVLPPLLYCIAELRVQDVLAEM